MNIVAGILNEHIVHSIVIISNCLEIRVKLVSLFHWLNNVSVVLQVIQVGDLTIVKDVVDIFNERFIDNLSIREKEDVGGTFVARREEKLVLHIFTPVGETVTLDHLEDLNSEGSNESGKLSKRLTAW